MSARPWTGDACSLVDAYRSGRHHPADEVEASLAAAAANRLNAFCHLDPERAREAAGSADVRLPFGGVPFAVDELDRVDGWPAADASVPFAARVASHTTTAVARLQAAGAVPVAQAVASELGSLNVSTSRLHGATGNPWNPARSAGGSSAGSAAAVAGGVVALATGSDGSGSLRTPAGFCGLVGLKATFGRIPRGPAAPVAPNTVVPGVLARSVRDVARHLDVAEGVSRRDPYSLPAVGGWESALGWRGSDLAGLRVAIVPDLGTAIVRPEVAAMVAEAAEELTRVAGWQRVYARTPRAGLIDEWAMAAMVPLVGELQQLGAGWQDHLSDLTLEVQWGLAMARASFDLETSARIEAGRVALNEGMAAMFDDADVVVCATNPDVAFPAETALVTSVGDRKVNPSNATALTLPSSVYGNPAISLPIGELDRLPVGMQLLAPHHCEALLLEAGVLWQRQRPWPMVAPRAPV